MSRKVLYVRVIPRGRALTTWSQASDGHVTTGTIPGADVDTRRRDSLPGITIDLTKLQLYLTRKPCLWGFNFPTFRRQAFRKFHTNVWRRSHQITHPSIKQKINLVTKEESIFIYFYIVCCSFCYISFLNWNSFSTKTRCLLVVAGSGLARDHPKYYFNQNSESPVPLLSNSACFEVVSEAITDWYRQIHEPRLHYVCDTKLVPEYHKDFLSWNLKFPRKENRIKTFRFPEE